MPAEVNQDFRSRDTFISITDEHLDEMEAMVRAEGMRYEGTATRSPAFLTRRRWTASDYINNKENLVPEKPRIRRSRLRFSAGRSPLPEDYPRAPLQDITTYIQRSTTRTRPRVRISRMAPIRQLRIHQSPGQEAAASESSPQEGPEQQRQAAEEPETRTSRAQTPLSMLQEVLASEPELYVPSRRPVTQQASDKVTPPASSPSGLWPRPVPSRDQNKNVPCTKKSALKPIMRMR